MKLRNLIKWYYLVFYKWYFGKIDLLIYYKKLFIFKVCVGKVFIVFIIVYFYFLFEWKEFVKIIEVIL